MSRNYDQESKDLKERKYAYNFDLDVIHHYMLKSFRPFFKKTTALELGSFEGDFTQRLLPFFKKIVCIEASTQAVSCHKQKKQNKVLIINQLFEDSTLDEKFDNIILTNVLEHLDDPIFLLQKVKNKWLSENGSLFLSCPNANAPSRQIAVKMGLIKNNQFVTDAERKHGHRRTYSLDTLEQDVVEAGLKVIYRSGIFFKALANFQWDALLQTNIISNEYLEGCYKLGQIYPDLCSNIFLLCKKD